MIGRGRQLLSKLLALARPGELPMCGRTLVVKLAENNVAVRCLRCRASAIHMSIARVVRQLYPDMSRLVVYEMSSRGPFYDFLRRQAGALTCSEFFDDVAPGEFAGHVQCQDVQRLTYANNSFDLCTSTEVFEHVPDDCRGFTEVHRVLRPGGRLIFTVPLTDDFLTVERARVVDGALQHILVPEYHGDVVRGHGKVLCFRNYGQDILQRLRKSGFQQARFVSVEYSEWWGMGVKVIVAEK
jgi:SAM-dependent methyltransferase